MTGNYLDSDAAVLCSYSETVRDLFLSMNAYHYPCSYKPVFYNNAYLSLLDCEVEQETNETKDMSRSPRRSHATKKHQDPVEDRDAHCAAAKVGDHLQATPHYRKSGIRPEQLLVYDTTGGRSNLTLSPWKAENDWDTDDQDLNANVVKKKERQEEQRRSPRSSKSDVNVQSASAAARSSNSHYSKFEKRSRSHGKTQTPTRGQQQQQFSSTNNSNTNKPRMNPWKAFTKSINSWMQPKDPLNDPTIELVVPFEHDLSWSQYAYQYRERKGLNQHEITNCLQPKCATTNLTQAYSKMCDTQREARQTYNIHKMNDLDFEVPLHVTKKVSALDKSSYTQQAKPKPANDKITLKGNVMHLSLPGNISPEMILRKTSSDHKRISLRGSNSNRNEFKPSAILSKTPTSPADDNSILDKFHHTEGLVSVCRSRPSIPTNMLGKLCITSIGTPAHRVTPPTSAGRKRPNRSKQSEKQFSAANTEFQASKFVGSYSLGKNHVRNKQEFP